MIEQIIDKIETTDWQKVGTCRQSMDAGAKNRQYISGQVSSNKVKPAYPHLGSTHAG